MEWPVEAVDTRVGVYGNRALQLQRYLVYDGETVSLFWPESSPRFDACPRPYDGLHSPRGMVRFHARLRGNTLQALVDCYGWVDVARFVDDGHVILSIFEEELWRLSPAMVPECRRERWLSCAPVYDPPLRLEDATDPAPEYMAPLISPDDTDGYPSLEDCRLEVSRRSGREGFYSVDPFRGYPERSNEVRLSYAFLDGVSIVMRYDPSSRPRVSCEYGSYEDVRAGIHRFEARLRGDAIEAHLPCEGWTEVGHFAGEALFLDGVADPLVRVDAGLACEAVPYEVCRPIYSPRASEAR